jgi:hypothetical protein
MARNRAVGRPSNRPQPVQHHVHGAARLLGHRRGASRPGDRAQRRRRRPARRFSLPMPAD